MSAVLKIDLTGEHVREYDSQIGRWISKDPALFAGGLNIFGYNFNDPINFVDSNGKNPFFAAIGVGATVGAFTNLAIAASAGILRYDNVIQIATIGAAAGATLVWTSGALAAAGTVATVWELITLKLTGSSILPILLTTILDVGSSILYNSPPDGSSLEEVQNGINQIKKPSCPKELK